MSRIDALQSAFQLQRAGRLDEAAAVYQRHLGENPDDPRALHAMGTLMLIELRDLPFAHDHTAHARADNDADSVGMFFDHLEAGIGQCFFGGDKGKLRITIHALGLYTVDVPFRGEPMNLAGHFGTVSVHRKRIKVCDSGNA